MGRIVNAILTSKWTKVVVFLACLLPLGLLIWRGFNGGWGANPIEFVTHATGDWTLRFLVITLAVTPLRKTLRLPQLIRFRRMMGLFAFFYAFLHFTIWFAIDKFFAWKDMLDDIEKRHFITAGLAAFLLLIPLAVTSTAGWIRRLGGRRWQWLHRLIYVCAILGVIHYYWQVKSDEHKPLEYAWMVGILLAWRVAIWLAGKWQRPVAGAMPAKGPATVETAEMV